MKINIIVKPRARKREVVENVSGEYVVSGISASREGKANSEAIETVAKYFNVAKSNVRIVSGKKSKKKILEIL